MLYKLLQWVMAQLDRAAEFLVDKFQLVRAYQVVTIDIALWPHWMVEALQRQPGEAGGLYFSTGELYLTTETGAAHVHVKDWVLCFPDGTLLCCDAALFECLRLIDNCIVEE